MKKTPEVSQPATENPQEMAMGELAINPPAIDEAQSSTFALHTYGSYDPQIRKQALQELRDAQHAPDFRSASAPTFDYRQHD